MKLMIALAVVFFAAESFACNQLVGKWTCDSVEFEDGKEVGKARNVTVISKVPGGFKTSVTENNETTAMIVDGKTHSRQFKMDDKDMKAVGKLKYKGTLSCNLISGTVWGPVNIESKESGSYVVNMKSTFNGHIKIKEKVMTLESTSLQETMVKFSDSEPAEVIQVSTSAIETCVKQ